MLSALIQHFSAGNKAQFAKTLGITPQTVSTWLARNTFDADKIFACCEGINGDWLLSGKGDMLHSEQKLSDISNSTVIGANVSGHGNNITHNDENNIAGMIELQKGYQDMMRKKDEQIDRLLSLLEKK